MSTDRILSQLLGSGAASGFAGGLAGGLASGLFTSKGGRKFGKKALKMGGIAAVGGLAYAAFQQYRQQQSGVAPGPQLESAGASSPVFGAGVASATGVGAPAPQATDFIPSEASAQQALGLVMLRAMVAASQADGKLDGAERHAIYERVGSLDLSEVEKAELIAQLNQPVDMSSLVAAATTPELAAEIYTASLLAIDVDTPAERAYLAMLAARLGLPVALVDSIHQELQLSTVHEVSVPQAQGAS